MIPIQLHLCALGISRKNNSEGGLKKGTSKEAMELQEGLTGKRVP